MRETRWLFHISAALLVLVVCSEAVAPFKKVSIATTTASSSSTTTKNEAPSAEAEENGKPENASTPTKNPKLTGIPQIDYIWDPNLPRELRGVSLSNYPFFATVPPEEDIHFTCDNLHDGFYASIEHKCQVYHHCVYGIRHDFLCANFTAFDQKTFICHFVSDVDCEGSKKYWNRNDDLYMATTTTSTTTTTTEPPPTPRRRPIQRPLRPLRRPVNRRPIDDYYYEDEEYDDDYYEERLNRRRKQRPRQRKPIVDYEDEYEDKRSFPAEDEKPRRPNSRDRLRGDEDTVNDYDTYNDRRKSDRSKPKNKAGALPERRKIGSRKPGTILARPNPDERRSFNDDRPLSAPKDNKRLSAHVDDTAEPEIPARRFVGRRRINEKRTSPSPATVAALDELDDYDKNQNISEDQDDFNNDEAPKIKATPKPLEEFVTPKAAPSSVFSRPRAPPRIPRPVPVTEKKKYQYPVQKTGTTTPTPAEPVESEDYYQDDYEDSKLAGGHPRRKIVDAEEEDVATVRRRNNKDTVHSKKPTRPTLRKPVTEKKPALHEDDYYDSSNGASEEHIDTRPLSRRRPYAGRRRPSHREVEDVDFVDEDYDDTLTRPAQRNRQKIAARKKINRKPIIDDDYNTEDTVYERPLRNRVSIGQSRRKSPLIGKSRQTPAPVKHKAEESEPEGETESEEEVPIAAHQNKISPSSSSTTGGRVASVRVVKRPFLPSRGGSPYLPRGLQPVGIAQKPFDTHTTDSTPIEMGSTISGVRLLEHGAPLLRDSGANDRNSYSSMQGPRTTLPPRSAIPVSPTKPEPQTKINLEELYENDYDVTLNDALDPTLKPLSPHQHQLQHEHYTNINNNKNNNNNNQDHNRNYQSSYSSAPVANTYPFNNPSISVANGNYQQQQAQQQQLSQQQSQHLQQQQHIHDSQNSYQSMLSSHHQTPHSSQSYLNHHHHQQQLSQHLLSQSPSQSQTQSQSQSQTQTQPHHQHQQQSTQQHSINNNYNSDSYFSSTDIRRRAIIPSPAARSSRTDYRGLTTRIAQHFYDDYDY